MINLEAIKSPLVVGYKGEIGSFILQGLLRTMPKASNIWCYDINETKQERRDKIIKADIIFLCIPIEKTVAWFKSYKSLLKNKVVFEQCSLKGLIYNNIKNPNFILLSMHILFRPSVTTDKDDRRVAIIKNIEWYRFRNSIEEITKSRLEFFDTWQMHDETMAFQQALVHRVILSLGNTLKDLSENTYIVSKIKELEKRIRLGEPKLYKIIQENKFLPKALSEFNKQLKKFKIEDEMGKNYD